MRDGLRALLMEVLSPFRRSSMCRHMHRALTRNKLLDLTTIVPATACHQKNYVGTYSRSMLFPLASLLRHAPTLDTRPRLAHNSPHPVREE